MVFDPKDPHSLQINFVHDGQETVKFEGHECTAFLGLANEVYIADYHSSSEGCTIVSYDVASGKRLWMTKLPLVLKGHSGYFNQVAVAFSYKDQAEGEPADAAIIITGREAAREYVAALDRKTGKLLALKIHRGEL